MRWETCNTRVLSAILTLSKAIEAVEGGASPRICVRHICKSLSGLSGLYSYVPMAKERMINTRIWSDNWVSELDPIEKLLFLYFLTNSYTNISGVYELPLKVAAVETGIDPSMLNKILPRLEPKVIHRNGWVILPKFPKYQQLKSKDVVAGIIREFECAPEAVRTEALEGGWGEGLGTVMGPSGDTKPNLTKPTVAVSPQFVEVTEGEERPRTLARSKDKELIYRLFSSKEQPWWRHAQQKKAALALFDLVGYEKVKAGVEFMKDHSDDKYCPQATTPFEYEEKLPSIAQYRKRNNL